MAFVTKLPNIPPAALSTDPELLRILEAIKEHVEVGDGVRGEDDTNVLRVRDIQGDTDVSFKLSTGLSGSFSELVSDLSGTEYDQPPSVSNLVANGTFAAIYLTWDISEAGSYSHCEVWRSATDGISAAEKMGTAIVGVYTDYVPVDATYYYWVRAVNPAGTPGAYNSPMGTVGSTSPDPAFLIEQISGEILSTDLHTTLQTQLDNLDNQYVVKVGQNGRMAGFGIAAASAEDDTFTFEVLADKFAIVNDAGAATVPFSVADGNVYINTAVIKDASISAAKIGNLTADVITGGVMTAAVEFTSPVITGGSLTVGDVHIDENAMTVGINNNGGTGLVITDDFIRVWEGGVLRVEIGLLS